MRDLSRDACTCMYVSRVHDKTEECVTPWLVESVLLDL